MEKKNLLLFFVLTSLLCYSQFPAKHPELLLNKEVTIKSLDQSLQRYGYENLHRTSKMKITDKAIRHSSVAGKRFIVIEVTPYEKQSKTRYCIKLQSPINGVYYYDYNPKYDFEYILDVCGGLEIPKDLYCDDISIEVDKFTGETISKSPYSEGVSFVKFTIDSVSRIYLSVNEVGSTLEVGKTGLILLLENSKRIEKSTTPIDVKVNSGYLGATGYVYSAIVKLTEDDIKLLSENAITDNRLYIFDGKIKNGQKLRDYLNCLIKY